MLGGYEILKRVWIVLIGMFLLIPLSGIVVKATPQIQITPLGGFFPGAIIRNTGNEDIHDLYYRIEVTGGVLDRVNQISEGYLSNLPAGDNFTMSIHITMFLVGFGPMTLTITIEGEGFEPISLTVQGFLIFVYIFLIPG